MSDEEIKTNKDDFINEIATTYEECRWDDPKTRRITSMGKIYDKRAKQYSGDDLREAVIDELRKEIVKPGIEKLQIIFNDLRCDLSNA